MPASRLFVNEIIQECIEKQITKVDILAFEYEMGLFPKIQEEANPGINASITDRFYGAACSTPVSVFPTLLRLDRHHLAKLESTGRKVYFERLIGEIVSHFKEFPAHLDLHEQGRFAVGFYHQRQDFFAKKISEE
jgi:CRISPR-associated protein Csd1